MKINHQRKLLELTLDKYRHELDLIPDEMFDVTPPKGGWSLAELYSHILQADYMSLIAVEKCAHKTCEHTRKGLNLIGYYVFLTGKFPPVKTKAPASIIAKKITKEEARNFIIKVRSKLDELSAVLNAAPADYKVKHPNLGMLNAGQWIKFIRIHTAHHLKQLQNIKSQLGL
ncbi:DinB family protein [Mucilaginibacter sp. KACC 22063]|uniref:DinB family protein n=1 Tax=Mucilaginibacter sp. KACC 22063 TaxID=3025666 RepID=UPI0023655E4D|nr:DinB family protein [Mucilaginibacter sp. KACC 22063]WDF55089.1 DinB family protein [Mucilaginibacter sp. KACC 22063]